MVLSKVRKGKTYEEYYGYEKAQIVKSKLSLSHMGKFPSWRHSGMKGKKQSKETIRKRTESLKKALQNPEVYKRYCGRPVWNKGVKWAPEIIKKFKDTRKRLWQDLAFREDFFERMRESKRNRITPNKPEKALIKLFKEESLPYKFVGNWEFVLGGKNPDFVNVNGQKKIIEMFGIYWHGKIGNRVIPYIRTEKGTIEHYTNFGFQTLVVWEDELGDIRKLTERIKDFNKN